MTSRVEYQYLRPRKAEILQSWHNKPFVCKEDLKVDTYPQAGILPLREFPGDTLSWGRGGMQDQDGNYITDSSMFTFYDYGYPVSEWEYREEKVVYCGYFYRHWGHFLLDSVARIWYCFQQDPTVDKYVFMVKQGESTELKGNYREFFSLLGVVDKIEIINQPTRYREVVLPQLSYDRRYDYWTKQFPRIFEAVAAHVTPDPSWEKADKIYMSRSKLPKALAMEAGLDMLDHYFEKNGFKLVYPEQLSLSQMIYLIRNASICATESGSLQHNMLFGADGQKIVIVERYAFNDREQPDVNIMKNLNAVYLDGNASIYPVELSYGPFVFYYNPQFERFTQDYGYQPPDPEYTSQKYRKRLFQHYISNYVDEHRYQWYMGAWMIPDTGSLYEAYEESLQYFGDYLQGRRPFRWHHYFELHYIKQFVKRMLKRA